MGDPDKADLQAALEKTGWLVDRRLGEDWWEHEGWALTSKWRPVGASAFITLLLDPAAEPNNVGSVWAVAVTPGKPLDRAEADRCAIRVSPRWPERMKEIVDAASLLRPSN
jgi:hypothetical protein